MNKEELERLLELFTKYFESISGLTREEKSCLMSVIALVEYDISNYERLND